MGTSGFLRVILSNDWDNKYGATWHSNVAGVGCASPSPYSFRGDYTLSAGYGV